jgi:hypothetical protein
MKISVKPKSKSIQDGDVKEVHIGRAENGGADVHVLHQGSKKDPFPVRKHTGSFSTVEEAMEHAGGHLGAKHGTPVGPEMPSDNAEGQEIDEQPAGPVKKGAYQAPPAPAKGGK